MESGRLCSGESRKLHHSGDPSVYWWSSSFVLDSVLLTGPSALVSAFEEVRLGDIHKMTAQ